MAFANWLWCACTNTIMKITSRKNGPVDISLGPCWAGILCWSNGFHALMSTLFARRCQRYNWAVWVKGCNQRLQLFVAFWMKHSLKQSFFQFIQITATIRFTISAIDMLNHEKPSHWLSRIKRQNFDTVDLGKPLLISLFFNEMCYRC